MESTRIACKTILLNTPADFRFMTIPTFLMEEDVVLQGLCESEMCRTQAAVLLHVLCRQPYGTYGLILNYLSLPGWLIRLFLYVFYYRTIKNVKRFLIFNYTNRNSSLEVNSPRCILLVYYITRVVPKVMSNFFCMRTGNSRRRRVRW